ALEVDRDRPAGLFHGFLHEIAGTAAMADATRQHPAERRTERQALRHFAGDLGIPADGEHFLEDARRDDLVASQGYRSFHYQGNGGDRGDDEEPDRPAGRLDQGKQIRNLRMPGREYELSRWREGRRGASRGGARIV